MGEDEEVNGSALEKSSPQNGMLLEIKEEIKSMNAKYNKLIEDIKFYDDKVSDFEVTIAKMEPKLKEIDQLKKENSDLKEQVAQLCSRVEDNEQYSRSFNLEFSGIPEEANKNDVDVFNKIALSVKCPVEPSEVQTIHRVVVHQQTKSSDGKKPERNFIVKFSTRIRTDSFYAASRLLKSEQKNRNSEIAVDGVTDSLYVNEHLIANNKYLFRNNQRTEVQVCLDQELHYLCSER
ncbi:hypothetical protein HHI36_001092 [Cryptolaemus montrouzieri]|uniref:Uncharacterized protein n=1 Tax=Cryptolaemus montrouzieri TaxID=559131 RepID=A0ABD2P6N1_9CUCU